MKPVSVLLKSVLFALLLPACSNMPAAPTSRIVGAWFFSIRDLYQPEAQALYTVPVYDTS